MQGLTRRWRLRSDRAGDGAPTPRAIAEIEPKPAPDESGMAPVVRRVLHARGMLDVAEANRFLDPRLGDLHDPSLIPDLDRAARRLLDAARAGEPIVIYGDYDVDGITATAILFHMLRTIAPDAEVRTYVPHRIDEGYGLNSEAIAQLAAEGARVIVTVDCGITAIEPALAARRAGVDLIITDHHNPPASDDDLPDAWAVVHPRRPGSAYPFGHLPGAGVAYKLAWRLATFACGAERVTPELRTLLVDLLAFAALGVIADVVPLVGENRIIARHGLQRVGTAPFVGIRALVEASGLAGDNVDATAVGFRLGPRLNAAGRMDHAQHAVELFTVADPARAAEIAAELNRQNQQRQATEREILEQAARRAEQAGMTGPDRRAIVLADPDWHPGVVGIVCSRLVERYCRPAILLCREGATCRGSGRSIPDYNLHAGLVACGHLLDRYGGHDMAAGLSLDAGRLDAFVEAFTSHADAHIEPHQLVHEVAIDCEAEAPELSVEAVTQLEALAPFGQGNPAVHLLLRGLRLDDDPCPLGSAARHLALMLKGQGRSLRTVAWGWGEHRARLARGMTVDVVVRPKLSRFRGRTSVEPEIKDLSIRAG